MTDTTFTAIDLTTDHPPNICPECSKHGTKNILSGTVYCFCGHSHTGVIRHPDGVWIIFNNTSLQKFKRDILGSVACYEIAADIVADGMPVQ